MLDLNKKPYLNLKKHDLLDLHKEDITNNNIVTNKLKTKKATIVKWLETCMFSFLTTIICIIGVGLFDSIIKLCGESNNIIINFLLLILCLITLFLLILLLVAFIIFLVSLFGVLINSMFIIIKKIIK